MIKKEIDIIKYLGIPFLHKGRDHNGIDCYGLIVLFYWQEFGIKIPDYSYDKDWYKHDFDYIQKEYQKYGKKINDPEAYCVIGLRMPGRAIEHHLGIMLPDFDSFLHSQLNKPTCVNRLSHPIWKDSEINFYKSKDKNNVA